MAFLTVLKTLFKKLLKNWKFVLATIGIIIAFIVASAFLKNKRALEEMKHKLNIKKYERDIAHLEGKREMLDEDEAESEEKLKEIDKKIEELALKAHEEKKRISELKLDELKDEFNNRGY